MAKLRKSKSTKEARRAAFEEMKRLLNEVPTLTDERILERCSALVHFSCSGAGRERDVIFYALRLAERIIDAS